jgi:hypothetical protein
MTYLKLNLPPIIWAFIGYSRLFSFIVYIYTPMYWWPAALFADIQYVAFSGHFSVIWNKCVLVLLNILISHGTKRRKPDAEFETRLFKVLSVLQNFSLK